MAWDSGLNRQTPAYSLATNVSDRIRVLAGPGTGKSFGLKRRIARLLEEGQEASRILAVTFTRTAALDLKNEINSIDVEGADKVVAKTLHSFCFGLLNRNEIMRVTGRTPRPMLEYEQRPMLYDLPVNGGLKDKQKQLAAFEAAWARLQSEMPGFPHNENDRLFEQESISWLKAHNAMLFGEMIIETYRYLRNNPRCSEKEMFDHILVDEYQDLNKAEQSVISLLSENCTLTIIGDDDQSIYSFKHAHPEGIREFPEQVDNCTSIDFELCRRCPKRVVSMAAALISNNTNRTLGDLRPYDSNQEGKVKLIQWGTLSEEISGIGRIVARNITRGKIDPQDVLILCPVRRIGYRIRDELADSGISVKSYFRETTLKTDELKRMFSILTLLAKPHDMVALRYLLGSGNADFRTKSYKRILQYANEHHLSTFEVLEKLSNDTIRISYSANLRDTYQAIFREISDTKRLLEENRGRIIDTIAPDVEDNEEMRGLLDSIIEEVGYMEDKDFDAWIKKIYESALDRISFPENYADADHVRIMSLHASKGLSAKFVVVMSCIDELLPGSRDLSDDVTDEEYVEERRRLFYVAITRCKSSCNDYPGALIISSFVSLPGPEALQINIPARPYENRRVRASRFISDFGDTAPETIAH